MADVKADGETCLRFVNDVLKDELERDESAEVARLSICLGALEACLTNKSAQSWPSELENVVAAHLKIFEGFVVQADAKIQSLDAHGTRAKVKIVADLVWANLTGAFSKDALHVQHLYSFTKILEAQKQQAKRHLDCAGVVIATLGTCQQLAKQERHAELAACRLQVSEDHCWVNFDAKGGREGSVEVTTDTAAKRGLAVSEERWRSWLYTGGHAVLCSPKMALAASVASLNPSIVARQNTGTDSEHLQKVQHDLLLLVQTSHPEAMYPAALCALADLTEIYSQDRAQEAVLANSHSEEAVVEALRQNNDAQGMFEEAVGLSLKNTEDALSWYPYSYLVGYLLRRAKYLLEQDSHSRGHISLEYARSLAMEALKRCGGKHAARVLHNYRYSPESEQLYKDVEGVLEMACETIISLQKQEGGVEGREVEVLAPLLELLDGICACWQGKPKPAAWISLILKTAKGFSPDARATAAAASEVRSGIMANARDQWKQLKVGQIKPLFETADVDDQQERSSKRPRR